MGQEPEIGREFGHRLRQTNEAGLASAMKQGSMADAEARFDGLGEAQHPVDPVDDVFRRHMLMQRI